MFVISCVEVHIPSDSFVPDSVLPIFAIHLVHFVIHVFPYYFYGFVNIHKTFSYLLLFRYKNTSKPKAMMYSLLFAGFNFVNFLLDTIFYERGQFLRIKVFILLIQNRGQIMYLCFNRSPIQAVKHFIGVV